MGSSDLKSFYFRKKMLKAGLMANSSSIELLTLSGLQEGKQRLKDNPLKITSLINQGIMRDTIHRMPIGLSKDWRLYMPLYNQKLMIGGIFYFDEKFETGSFEWTMNSPNYVVGNPMPYSNSEEKEEVLVCSTLKEVIFAFQLGFKNPIMVVDQEHFPHSLFSYFHRISMLHQDDIMADMIGREWFACYHLDHELCQDDLLDTLYENKRFINRGMIGATHMSNPFFYIDKLWWHIQSPVSRARYLVNSDWDSFELKMKNIWKKNYLETVTDYGSIRVESDALQLSLGDQKVSIPTTEEVYLVVFESLMNIFPYMQSGYIAVLTHWIMYSYVFPHFPFAPQNLSVHFEDNLKKSTFAFYMNKFFVPFEKSGQTYSMSSAQLLRIERSSLPSEGQQAPRLYIASITDNWFTFSPSMIIADVTGNNQDLRDQKFIWLRGIRSLLFRWSLGFKGPKASELVIPRGMSNFSFLFICENRSEIERMFNAVFSKTDEFIAYISRRREIAVPKNITPSKIMKNRVRTLSDNEITLWNNPLKNRISKKKYWSLSEASDSSASESMPD